MSLYTALAAVALLLPLLIFFDHRASQANPERDPNQRGPDTLILFTPFLIFFYSEAFWQNLLWFIPLYVYFALVFFIANYSGWYKVHWGILMYHSYGSFALVALGYFLFLHSGPKSPELNEVEESKTLSALLFSLWPYYAALLLVIVSLIVKHKNQDFLEVSSIIMVFGFPFLPFFAPYYWLGLLLLTVLCIFTLFQLAKDAGTGAGAYAAFMIFHLMAVMTSIIIRAIFF